jgi:hypothetical protein
MSERIQTALDALAGTITDELGDAEKQRLDAVKAASDAAVETNRLRDALTAQQAALAASAAENARLHKLLESGGSGIPLWTPATVVSAGGTWIVPDGTRDNIIGPAGAVGVTLYLMGGLWPKIPSRPFLSIYGDLCKVIGVPGRFTFDAPSGASASGNGRYGIAECVRVGQEAQPYNSPVRGTVLIDVSLNRADALAKLYPDCDGATLVRLVTTTECRADGVFVGGAKNVRVIDPDLTCTTENTIRATTQNGVTPSGITVAGGSVRNIGNKAALNPRHVNGFVAFGVRLFATGENSAVGIGNGDSTNPGNPIGVSVIGCIVEGGGLTLHQAHGVELLRNQFRWPGTRANSAIGVTAASADNVTITDNSGESAVPQKAMVGYVGDRSKIRNLTERDNAWSVKP